MSVKDFNQISKKHLEALYREQTTSEIAASFAVSQETVRKRMVFFKIERRQRGCVRVFSPPHDELYALYQEKSMKQISRIYGVGETVVWKRLKELDIKLKDFEDGGHRKKPGREFTRDHKKNLSKAHTGKWIGKNNPNWKGGIYDDNLKLRRTGKYKQWRIDALLLNENKCQSCGIENKSVCECCGVKITLHVHHVKRFADFPDLRFAPENSEVLCPKCHHHRHHGKIG